MRRARLAIYPTALSADQEQVLLGGLLGDGCLIIPKGSRLALYKETHSIAQESYLRWKREIFDNLGAKVWSHPATGKSGGFQMGTGRAPVLVPYRELFYGSQGKALPSDEWLDRLTPLALAVWFMDDGSFSKTRQLALSTDSFNEADHERLVRYFDRSLGVVARVQPHKAKNTLELRFRLDDALRILGIIKPHLHPMFCAKWRLDRSDTFTPAVYRGYAHQRR